MRSCMKRSFGLLIQTIIGGMILEGCAYQFGHGELSHRYATITVPYAEGDQKGDLTAEVIKNLSTSGAFQYVNGNSDLILTIKLIDMRDENVGFRYDRKRTGKLKKSILPTETRINALAEVLVIEAATGNIIRGPTRITASTDFDHSYYKSRNGINVFSIGQLNDIDAAREAAIRPLNRRLAERIVDYVINSW